MASVHRQFIQKITIPAGGYTHADPLDVRGKVPIAVIIPSAWTPAPISFSGSPVDAAFDPANYGWLSSSASKVLKISPVNAYGYITLQKKCFDSVQFLFFVSGDLSLATTTNQAADRTLIIILEETNPTTVVNL